MVMKKNILLLIVAMACMTGVFAQNDQFPNYSVADYNIAIDLDVDSMTVYMPDPDHYLCGHIMYYELNGMAPTTQSRWINSVGGSQNASTANTPPALLCKLLKNYENLDLESLLALYRPEDRARIQTMLSNAEFSSRWTSSVSQVNKMDFLLSFQEEDITYAFVDAYHDDEVWFNTYYAFEQIDGTWYFATTIDSLSLLGNLKPYLHFYSPSTLLASNDFDEDGVLNMVDNCPCFPNPDQGDIDRDGFGDECDNCRKRYNPDQEDFDRDGVGDECDNCIFEKNPGQEDTDNDGIGDACDYCPYDFDKTNEYTIVNDSIYVGLACDPDIDHDGIPNELDDDMDGDGWPNVRDNCPRKYNPNQVDSDLDGIGDDCDNCQLKSNPGQEDKDHDGIGDVCDDDQDGDEIPDEWDNCPCEYNPDQEDDDCNGIGNACQDF